MGDMPDLSSLFEMLNNKNIDINGLMQNMSQKNTSATSPSTPSLDEILYNSSSNTTNESSNSENFDFQMPDMETMMKIMKLMRAMNENNNNPSANLLYSLKPFLRDSKKEKIDQYIKFLKISSIFSEINKPGGDFK